ncbi:MAG: lysostaphin resistance A-like protein [Solirubrobacteraceae bacterium]
MTARSDRDAPPYWIALAAVVLGFAGGVLVTIIAEGVGVAFGASASNPPPAVNIAADFLFDAAFVAAALYLSMLGGRFGGVQFGYVRIAWSVGLVAFVLAAVGYYVVTLLYALIVSVHGTDRLPTDLGVQRSTAAAIAAGVFVCVVAPIAEEFFFRGFLFGVLRRLDLRIGGRQLGPWLAAVAVGILFGLAHYDSAQPEFLIPLGFLGFVLCVMRWKTGSLYPGMALHCVNNCIALGVNELAWGAGLIAALCAAALLAMTLLTGPLSAGVARAST